MTYDEFLAIRTGVLPSKWFFVIAAEMDLPNNPLHGLQSGDVFKLLPDNSIRVITGSQKGELFPIRPTCFAFDYALQYVRANHK